MTDDDAFTGDRIPFSPEPTLRATIGSALEEVGGSWEEVTGIVLYVPHQSIQPESLAWEFDSDFALVRVPDAAVPMALDAVRDVPWDAGWAPGMRETNKFTATIWLPDLVMRFVLGFGIGEGVICEAFSLEPPGGAVRALGGIAPERTGGQPDCTVADGLRVLRSIARQLGSEDDRDSERCIVEAVEIVEEALAHGRIDGSSPSEGRFPHFLKEVWSARRSSDGTHLEPGERISGVGIMTEAYGPRVDPDARHWMEDLGRIERGAPFFVVEAPFRLVPAVQAEATDPKPTEGDPE